MPPSDCEVRDPRIRRTRQMLQSALQKLLKKKQLDEILVQDITNAAELNRATFYDHYTDKFGLFEAMVARDFHCLLRERNVCFDGACSSGLTMIILAVCDYLTKHAACTRQSAFTPLMEAAVTTAIGRVLLEGFEKQRAERPLPAELVATSASWAIFGAAKSWFHMPDRQPPEEVAPAIVRLILPLLEAGAEISQPHEQTAAPQNKVNR